MRKYHVRFGGGRMEKVHAYAVTGSHAWNLASRLPYIIWGFQHVATFRRRHVGASIQRDWSSSLDSLQTTLDADTAQERTLLLRASSQELGATREAVIEAAVRRLELSQKSAHQAYGLAEQYEPNPRSIWGYIQGLTRLSQSTPYQDERFTLDRAASRLLATLQ